MQHIDESQNKSLLRKGKGKCKQLISNCVRQTLKLVQSGRKAARAHSYSGCDWAAGTNGSGGHRCSSVCNFAHDSSKPLFTLVH